jgi:hypothetical protein
MKRKTVVLFFCLALILPMATTVFAADHVTLRVLVVKSDNADAYVKELAKGQALLKKLGSSAIIRVWRARFAGENAGAIVVSVEYPSLMAMAKDEAAVEADADYQTWFKGLEKLRTIVSDSIYNELKP